MTVQRQTFRIKLFVGLFIATLAIHLAVLYFIVPAKEKAPAEPPKPAAPTAPSVPSAPQEEYVAPVPAVPVTPAQKQAATTVPRIPARADLPPEFSSREPLRKRSTSPQFGKPFRFSSARPLPKRLAVAGTRARAGIIVDLDTRRVLWQKNANTPVPVASMSKMLTLLLAFEEMERNPALTLATPVRITDAAVKVKRDGVLNLKKGDVYPFGELIQAAIIRSSNDAAEQIGEVVCGSVAQCTARMNQRAKELGIPNAEFVNPSGLPDAKRRNSRCSMTGMIKIGERLLVYPVLMRWARSRRVVLHDGKELISHNHLISPRTYPGVDGLKTGYTRAAGSCLTFSVLRNGRRMMGCVAGFPSAADRDNFCRQLIDWAYSLK